MPSNTFFPPRTERGTLDYVADDFPFPLALTYVRLHEEMDQQEPIAAAWQLRDAFECLLKFTACLAVADALHVRPEPDQAGRLVGLLLKPQGLALGDWHTLLIEALKPLEPWARAGSLTASARRLPMLFPVFFDVRGRLRPSALNRKIDGEAESFVTWRNRVFGHGVFKQERHWYAEETLRWLPTLHVFYAALRPILDGWTLIAVTPGSDEVVWQGAGDLPSPARRHHHEPWGNPLPMVLTKSSAGSPQRLPFGPLLSVQQCALCQQPAVFFFDRYKYEREKNRHQTFFLEYFRGHYGEHRDWEETRKLAVLLPLTFEWQRTSYDTEEVIEGVQTVFRDFQSEYWRPDYLLDAFWRLVDEQPKGYVHLVGPSGVGKTYFVRGLEREGHERGTPVLAYYILPGALTDYRTFITVLADRAQETLRFRTQEAQSKVATLAQLQEQFVEFIQELMRANRLDTLIIAIDALDELPDPAPHAAAITDFLPSSDQLPNGCFVLLTSRATLRPKIREHVQRLRSYTAETTASSAPGAPHFALLEVAPATPDNQRLVRAYLQERLPEPFLAPEHVEAVLERCGGVFLYAFHFCRALTSGVFPDVTALPEGSQFYSAYLARLRERTGEVLFDTVYLPLLLSLAAAQQPVTLTQLHRWGIPRDKLLFALLDLHDFLYVHRVRRWHDSLTNEHGEHRYEIAHEAFVRFVRDALSAQWRDTHALIARLALTTHMGRWGDLDPTDDAELYDLRFVLSHVKEGRLTEEESRLRSDHEYAAACDGLGRMIASEYHRAYMAIELFDLALSIYAPLIAEGHEEFTNALTYVYERKGWALDDVKRFAEAIACYDEAIDIRRRLVESSRKDLIPHLALTLRSKGLALARLGSLVEAIVCCDEAIQTPP